MKRLLLLTSISLGALLGCTVPPPPPPGKRGAAAKPGKPGAARQPTDEELGEVLDLARAVVVARVEERTEREGTVSYRLRVEQALVAGGDEAHPVVEGQELTASDFLFRPGRAGGSTGPLVELERYLFFLAPQDQAGAWFHLDDPSGYPMPAARPVRERVEALIAERNAGRKQQPAGKDGGGRPEDRRPGDRRPDDRRPDEGRPDEGRPEERRP
ncbi:MAG: hypothetical protein AB7N76_04360 [Planctomycetota bacterium]